VHVLLDNLKKTAPKTVEELIPDQLKVSQVHQVLCNLLREQVPIRDLESILTALGNYAGRTQQNLDLLTEYARMALMRTICQQYRDDHGVLHAITLDPTIEHVFDSSRNKGEPIDLNLHVSPQLVQRFLKSLEKHLEALLIRGYKPVVVCSPVIRRGLKTMTEDRLPKLAVLSTNEITRDTELESLGQVSAEELQPAAATAGAKA
jgi:flagellar biosynthesis protein FlhA